MDRAYLEERLSAYVDGELPANELAEFEGELQKHPDLLDLVERMRHLDKLAKSTQVEMPDERYFEQLAQRIEAKLPEQASATDGADEEPPLRRASIVDFLAANRRTVSIVGSVAAVLLVTLIGVQIFGPNTPKYPSEMKTYEVKPAIDRKQVDKSEAAQPATPPDTLTQKLQGRQIEPVPEVEGERVDTAATAGSEDEVRLEPEVSDEAGRVEIEIQPQSVQPVNGPANEDQAVIPAEVPLRGDAKMRDSGPRSQQLTLNSISLGTTERIISTKDRPSVDSQRAFAYTSLGYAKPPQPQQFATGVLDSLDHALHSSNQSTGVTAMKKSGPASESLAGADEDADASLTPDQRELLLRAELAYSVAASDSSNVYDIIYARLLADKVAPFAANKATWARRLMELTRLEQFERKRWNDAHTQRKMVPATND